MDKAVFMERIRRATERWGKVNPQELEQLARLAMTLPVEQRFNVLAQAFVAPPHDAYLAQEYAGQLLTMLKPPCPTPARRIAPAGSAEVEPLCRAASFVPCGRVRA